MINSSTLVSIQPSLTHNTVMSSGEFAWIREKELLYESNIAYFTTYKEYDSLFKTGCIENNC